MRGLWTENTGSASGNSPGSGKRALTAVTKRKTKFFFGAGKVKLPLSVRLENRERDLFWFLLPNLKKYLPGLSGEI